MKKGEKKRQKLNVGKTKTTTIYTIEQVDKFRYLKRVQIIEKL